MELARLTGGTTFRTKLKEIRWMVSVENCSPGYPPPTAPPTAPASPEPSRLPPESCLQNYQLPVDFGAVTIPWEIRHTFEIKK